MSCFACPNPPSQEAIQQALTILQNSIHYENGTVPLKDPLSNACHSQLDYHITAIEAAFSAFKSQSDLHVAHLKRYRNTLSPVHKLPNELLSTILLLSFDHRNYTLHTLQRLARVCKAWHKIVSNTPSFWTRINFDAPPHVLRLFLHKSKSSGLAIECCTSSSDSVLPSKVEDFVEMTHKYAPRWTSFKYKGNATQRIMRNIESAGKEKLRELSVHFSWHYRQSWLFNLPKDAPLERISLTSASLDWTAACKSQLRNLKSLELKDLHMNPPKLHLMVEILTASPELESLVLVGITTDSDDASASLANGLLEPTAPAIHLSELHSLLLKNVPAHFHTCFLSRIVAPRCRRLIDDAVPPQLFAIPAEESSAQQEPRLFDLLTRPIIRASPKLVISAQERLNHIRLVTNPEPSDEASFRPGVDLTFETDVPMTDLLRISQFVGAALSPPFDEEHVNSVPQVIVKAGKMWWWDDDQDVVILPPAALEALHPYLVHLEIGRGVNGTQAVHWLAQPLVPLSPTNSPTRFTTDPLGIEVVPGSFPTELGPDHDHDHADEEVEYPCPRLSHVLLQDWSGDAEAIAGFLTNRWWRRRGGSPSSTESAIGRRRSPSEDGYSSSGSSGSRSALVHVRLASPAAESRSSSSSSGPVKLDELSLPSLMPQRLRDLYLQTFWKSSRYRRRPGPNYQCPI